MCEVHTRGKYFLECAQIFGGMILQNWGLGEEFLVMWWTRKATNRFSQKTNPNEMRLSTYLRFQKFIPIFLGKDFNAPRKEFRNLGERIMISKKIFTPGLKSQLCNKILNSQTLARIIVCSYSLITQTFCLKIENSRCSHKCNLQLVWGLWKFKINFLQNVKVW